MSPIGPVGRGEEFPVVDPDELREEDVTAGDVLDDRVAEADGLERTSSGRSETLLPRASLVPDDGD